MISCGSPIKRYDYLLKFQLIITKDVGLGEILGTLHQDMEKGISGEA